MAVQGGGMATLEVHNRADSGWGGGAVVGGGEGRGGGAEVGGGRCGGRGNAGRGG